MYDEISILPAGPQAGPRGAPLSDRGGPPAGAPLVRSYRARRTGMDRGTRRLVMAASALGLVLLAGMGAWSLTGRRAVGVPLIEADPRPLRVRPADPGGMTVIGAGEQVLGDGTEATGDLAPAAERPDPQALRAQRQALAAPAGVVPEAVAVAPAPVAPAVAAPAVVAPAVVAPVAVAPVAVAPVGRAMVQVASVESEAGAAAEWARLSRKMPELLGERSPVVQRAEAGGHAVWRVRTGGFADVAAATQFCVKVRARGAGCSLANF